MTVLGRLYNHGSFVQLLFWNRAGGLGNYKNQFYKSLVVIMILIITTYEELSERSLVFLSSITTNLFMHMNFLPSTLFIFCYVKD